MLMRRFVLLATLVLLLAPRSLGADSVLITSTLDDHPSRGWAVYRNSQREHMLVYFAPRDDDAQAASGGAARGQIQAVRALGTRLPIAIGARGERAYLVFPPTYADGKRLMRVYTLRAIPSPVGGLWTLDPASRFDVERPIVSDANLIGFQATGEALWTLLKDGDDVGLLRLGQSDWEPATLPDDISTRRLELRAIGNDPVLIDRSGLEFIAYQLETGTNEWQRLGATLPIAKDTRLLSGQHAIHVIDENDEGTLRVRLWSGDGVFQLAEGVSVPEDTEFTLLSSSATLLGIYEVNDTGEDDQQGAKAHLIELNARTGDELYRGAPSVTSPVSEEEFRFLVVMMVLVMSGVLVVVILPDKADSMAIPDGVALADPGRRLMATMIDVVAVSALVGSFVGVSAADIITLAVIVQPGNSWAVFPLTIISGIVYSTLTEFLFAGTPGKLIARIRLVSAEPGLPHRPRPWSILVRNIIKWVLPPVAALALIDPETLHRGDRVSRSLVVVPRSDPDPDTN